jgi:endonuclease/exonuclease/phosphatase family metal-dependent hydrolase
MPVMSHKRASFSPTRTAFRRILFNRRCPPRAGIFRKGTVGGGREPLSHAVEGATLLHPDGHYGNGLVTRCPVVRSNLLDLNWRGREPRGAICADLDCSGEFVRVVATHLGLRPAERREQVESLLRPFRQNPGDRAVLLGDLNEWFLWGRPLRRLHRYFQHTLSRAHFPR